MNENKFTPRAEESLRLAQEAAQDMGHDYVGCEHLLLGLLREEEGIAHRVLTEYGLTDEMISGILRHNVGQGTSGDAPSQGLTPRAKSVIELAVGESHRMGAGYIGTEHLLMGLLREGSNMAVRILRTVGVDPRKMYASVQQKLSESSPHTVTSGTSTPNKENKKTGKTLEEFTRDLTEAARQGKLDPVIGRDKEIQRVVQILSRRTKNNPVLIGEPGVGKTAIADAHQDNVGDRQAGIQLGKEHLIKKLRRLQPPDKAADGRRAELAAHRAADLRGDADGVAVVVLHDDGFDAVAVTQPPEIFDRPVKPGDLLAGDGGLIDEIEAVQRFAQGLGEVRHGLEADRAAVQPREDLLCAEFRFAKRRERVLQLGQRHGFDILFHACFLSLQMKKPSAACLCGRSAA